MTLAARIERLSIPEPTSGCWLWLSSMRGYGYGCLSIGGRTEGAHRASWMAHYGDIPSGMQVCHRCDNRACVNPEHLFLGTNADNAGDMARKGRAARLTGEKQGAHKLAEADARAILDEPSPISRRRSQEMADKYGISRTYIYDIRAGIAWRHLSGKQSPRPRDARSSTG